MKLPDPFRILLCAAVCLSGLSTGIAQEGVPSVPGSIDAGAQVSGSYVISPLDYLRVALFVADEAQFQTEVRVSQSGTITVPHLGTVQVAGKSIEEMRDDLYAPYNRDYYVNPHIDVVVLGYSERSVTVIGKVNRQGLIPFPSEEGLTLLQAIALAGGWSADRLSDKRNVTITRTDEDGERFVIQVDARNITSSEYPLREGDLINVPERIW
jgi:polysaccharide biosynthesis/export protein